MQAVGELAASWLGVPLMIGDDFLGVMAVQDYQQTAAYDEHALDILRALASQAAIAIQNARLFEESRKFRLGLERSADAVFMTDIEGTIVFANPSFEKIYGFPLDEVIGKNPRIIKSGLISQEQYKIFWDTLLNKETVAGEIINKAKDGRLIPIERTNSPILDEGGKYSWLPGYSQ